MNDSLVGHVDQLHSTLLKQKVKTAKTGEPRGVGSDGVGSSKVSRGLIRAGGSTEEMLVLSPVKEAASAARVSGNESLQTLDGSVEAEGASGEEMFEKLVYFVFKLVWEGVVGSHQDAWKVSESDSK